jgi:hypothetical protein
MSKRKPAPAVAVHWIDAAMSTDPHWQEGQQPKVPKRKSAHRCVTVGFLVHADDEWVQLVATLTDGAHAHVTEIPRGMVTQIIRLSEAGPLDI